MGWLIGILAFVVFMAVSAGEQGREEAGIERGGCSDVLLWLAALAVVAALLAVAGLVTGPRGFPGA